MDEHERVQRARLVRASRALGWTAGALAMLTLVWRAWIELVFRVDPDGGSGALEWVVVLALAAVSAGCLLWARSEHRRLQAAGG